MKATKQRARLLLLPGLTLVVSCVGCVDNSDVLNADGRAGAAGSPDGGLSLNADGSVGAAGSFDAGAGDSGQRLFACTTVRECGQPVAGLEACCTSGGLCGSRPPPVCALSKTKTCRTPDDCGSGLGLERCCMAGMCGVARPRACLPVFGQPAADAGPMDGGG